MMSIKKIDSTGHCSKYHMSRRHPGADVELVGRAVAVVVVPGAGSTGKKVSRVFRHGGVPLPAGGNDPLHESVVVRIR